MVIAATTLGAACQRDRASANAANPSCDANLTSITDTSIGPLYLGEAVAALRARCGTVIDTTVVFSMPGRVDTAAAKRLTVAGAPVLAIHDGERIVALRVAAPGPRTLDGIEVRTTYLTRFKREGGLRVSRSAQSGAVLLQDRSHCGTVFELSGWGGTLTPAENDPPLAAPAIASWPDTIVVRAITVSSCKEPQSVRAVDSAFNAREDTMSVVPDSTAPQVSPPSSKKPPG